MTQQQLSDRLQHESGVSLDTSAITRIEAGQREPRLGEAIAIAQVLEFGLDELAPRSDLDSYISEINQSMNESRAALVKMIRSVDPLVEFVRQNPSCLGDGSLEELFEEVIERFYHRVSPENFGSGDRPTANFASTTSRADERLKRQLLRAVSDEILVRADEVQPAYDRWFKEDLSRTRRTRRKVSTTDKRVRGRQRFESRPDGEQ